MSAVVSKSRVTQHQVTEIEPHRFITEASDLGLRPGEWPASLPTSLGNGRPLILDGTWGGSKYYRYRQEFGCVILDVFND